jgi:hypothetical protein
MHFSGGVATFLGSDGKCFVYEVWCKAGLDAKYLRTTLAIAVYMYYEKINLFQSPF